MLVELPDYTVCARRRRSGESSLSQRDLSSAVSEYGVELDEETATDGNCGLDAMLRNLERLKISTEAANKIMNLLAKKGRASAWQAMRLMLLIWISRNPDVEILPGVTLSQLITMDGQSLDEYKQTMTNPCVWLDTPMLLAMSGVF